MRFFKFLSLCMTVVLIMFGVSGCMKDNKVINVENNVNSILKYMEEKYNDTFEYAGSFGGSDDGKTKNIYVVSKNYPGNEISVCYHNDDGIAYITENYTQYRFKNETEEYITSMMKDLFGADVIITYIIASQGTENNFTDKTTFEEYISSEDSDIVFKAVVSNLYKIENMADVAERVKRAVEEISMIGNAEIYFASSPESFKSYSNLGFFEKKELNRIYFSKDTKNSIADYDWR